MKLWTLKWAEHVSFHSILHLCGRGENKEQEMSADKKKKENKGKLTWESPTVGHSKLSFDFSLRCLLTLLRAEPGQM